MTTVINSVTVADPAKGREGYRRTEIDVAEMHEMASGALVIDYTAQRWRHTFNWVGLADSDRTAIYTNYVAGKTASISLSPPDGSGPHTVYAVPNSYAEDYDLDSSATKRWYIACAFEDAS